MPNWVEGSMKLRGSVKEIKRFLRTEIVDGSTGEPLNERFEYGSSQLLLGKYATWFKGSRRAFVNDYSLSQVNIDLYSLDDVAYDNDSEDVQTVFEIPFKQAWSLNTDWLRSLTKKYSLDIKVFGYECGMQFYDIVECSKGDITATSFRSFKELEDYAWEVPFMEMGG